MGTNSLWFVWCPWFTFLSWKAMEGGYRFISCRGAKKIVLKLISVKLVYSCSKWNNKNRSLPFIDKDQLIETVLDCIMHHSSQLKESFNLYLLQKHHHSPLRLYQDRMLSPIQEPTGTLTPSTDRRVLYCENLRIHKPQYTLFFNFCDSLWHCISFRLLCPF